jgi:hypothetical protein
VYYLVMLRDTSDWPGPFDGEPIAGVGAAYVLRCHDIDDDLAGT